MRQEKSDRGFYFLLHDTYADEPVKDQRLASESSCASYPALWIGEHFHLNEQEVRRLRDHLNLWLNTGRLCRRASRAAPPTGETP